MKVKNIFITPYISRSFTWKSIHKYFVVLTIRNINHIINEASLKNKVDFTTDYQKNVKYN